MESTTGTAKIYLALLARTLHGDGGVDSDSKVDADGAAPASDGSAFPREEVWSGPVSSVDFRGRRPWQYTDSGRLVGEFRMGPAACG